MTFRNLFRLNRTKYIAWSGYTFLVFLLIALPSTLISGKTTSSDVASLVGGLFLFQSFMTLLYFTILFAEYHRTKILFNSPAIKIFIQKNNFSNILLKEHRSFAFSVPACIGRVGDYPVLLYIGTGENPHLRIAVLLHPFQFSNDKYKLFTKELYSVNASYLDHEVFRSTLLVPKNNEKFVEEMLSDFEKVIQTVERFDLHPLTNFSLNRKIVKLLGEANIRKWGYWQP